MPDSLPVPAHLWPLLDQALADALELPEPERLPLLHERLASHPALLEHAFRLLREAPAAEAFFERQRPFFPSQGAALGPWRFERELGRGGMGVVWLASRQDGAVQMRAAIKLLNTPFATPDLLARFQREKQILASLQHPNIAHLLDTSLGASDLPSFAPNFAMEFIEGLPFPEHCASLQLSLTLRVRLARQLLDALQYAHSKLVVHRDLKPGNILCTVSGIPKLLDFGIARLIEDANLANPANPTETIYRAFSADYASPEQLRGEPVSTSADIFSISLVFFEAFTGSRARQWSRRPIAEILRDSDSFQIPAHPALPPDLHAILLKASDPLPARRYPTASEFSADLGRFLDGRPVSARKASFAYVTLRYARRHLLAVSAAALAIAAILGVSAAALHQARQAALQRQLAVQRQGEAERAAARALESRELAQQALARAESLRILSDERRQDMLRLSYSFLEDSYREIASLPGATPVRVRLLERTLSHLDRLEASGPDDPSLLLLLTDALGNLTDAYGGQNSNLGDHARALALLTRREQLVARLAALRPSSLDVERLRLDNLTRQIALRHRDDRDERRRRLADLEPSVNRLLRLAPPSSPLCRFAVSYFFQRAFSLPAPADRLPYYRRVLQFASDDERLFGGDEVCWRSTAIAHKYIAGSLSPANPEHARHARLAVDYDEKRVALNPVNATARMDLSFSRSTLATSLQNTGRATEAAAVFRDVFNLRLNLLELDPSNQWYRNSLWFPLLTAIQIHFDAAARHALRDTVNDLALMTRRYPPPPHALATLLFMEAELLPDSSVPAACDAWRKAGLFYSSISPADRKLFRFTSPLQSRLDACSPPAQSPNANEN